MKLLLCRHGHVEGISPPRFRGRREQPLTELGEWQAQALGARIAAEWKPARIYTSPMGRSIATGAAIAAATGAPAEVSDRFNDFDYGAWSWKALAEVERADPVNFRRWFASPHLFRIPGGDSLQDVIARTADGLRHILDAHPDETIVVVAHDSANRALLLQLADMPLSAYWSIRQDPACLNEIDIDTDGVRIGRINETAFLAPPASSRKNGDGRP
ncbi:MAG: histidine phosphatase family protein [Sphingomonas bacterium]